ncbi:MAG: prepilin-type N-terminal cleavage/methylation domain-containing protein [Phycisphaerales bacterium]
MSHQPRSSRSSHALAVAPARAFTLVEVLVTLTVLAVLVALALPSIGASAFRARETRSAANMRQAMIALSAYAADHRDAWPYLQSPGRFDGPVTVLGKPVAFSYFAAGRTLWASVLVPTYFADGAGLSLAPLDRVRARNIEDAIHPDAVRSSIELSACAFARPEWFAPHTLVPAETLLAPTHHADVAFPSRKGVLLESGLPPPADEPFGVPSALLCGRADGSVKHQPLRGAGPDSVVERWRFGVPTWPVMSTTHGWRGIDFGM